LITVKARGTMCSNHMPHVAVFFRNKLCVETAAGRLIIRQSSEALGFHKA
jgi:hypothetical protein